MYSLSNKDYELICRLLARVVRELPHCTRQRETRRQSYCLLDKFGKMKNYYLRTDKDKYKIIADVTALDLNDNTYDVSIRNHKELRSISQNRLYWLWLTCIARETGNDVQLLHETFKQKFLTPESKLCLNTEVTILPSTTKLNTAAYSRFLDAIQAFASSELGIMLPQPNDVEFSAFLTKYGN